MVDNSGSTVMRYWKTMRFNDTTPSHVVLVLVSAYSRRAHVRLPRGIRHRRRLTTTSGDVMRPRHPLLLLMMLITPRHQSLQHTHETSVKYRLLALLEQYGYSRVLRSLIITCSS